MAVMWAIDFYDTFIKGPAHLHALGFEYDARFVAYLVCSLIAMRTKNERFHAAFAVLGTLYEVFFFLRQFFTVG